jgi:hypothetical protein
MESAYAMRAAGIEFAIEEVLQARIMSPIGIVEFASQRQSKTEQP